jgi:CobQ-like glutamine amidotransferase family enzyme
MLILSTQGKLLQHFNNQVQEEREIETKIKEIEPGVIVCAANNVLIYLYERQEKEKL